MKTEHEANRALADTLAQHAPRIGGTFHQPAPIRYNRRVSLSRSIIAALRRIIGA